MHWYKIEVNKGESGTYHFVGSSELDVDTLTKRAEHGFFIRLDDLLYMDRGQVKEWGEWDKTLIPSAHINSKDVVAVMEFKGDPRELPRD
jgi:hypothetical protein